MIRASVALATYNGSRFLDEQLRSIVEQSLRPWELSVSDDLSSDGTLAILEKWKHSLPISCHVQRQSSNVGVVCNFEKAISRCDGDVVFLCDQDDVWHPSKVERIMGRFEMEPELGLVFSNARLVNDSLQPLGQTLWEALRLGSIERSLLVSPHAFDLLLRRFLVTGATLAFRRTFLVSLLPFSKHMLHDAWIALMLSSISRVGIVDEPLIDYRQHDAQQIGERDKMRSLWTQFKTAQKMDIGYFENQLHAFSDVRDRVRLLRDQWVHPDIGRLADEKVRHCESRIRIREGRLRGLPSLVREAATGHYGRFSYGWKSIAQDLFL